MRLEGWEQVSGVKPSFETRAFGALLQDEAEERSIYFWASPKSDDWSLRRGVALPLTLTLSPWREERRGERGRAHPTA